jgi:hypothetical protein
MMPPLQDRGEDKIPTLAIKEEWKKLSAVSEPKVRQGL